MLVNEYAGEHSNSYVSLIEADEYFDNHPFAEMWNALLDKDKEKYLIYSTTIIDTMKLIGTPVKTTQSLHFPIVGMTVIPKNIKKAQLEQAIHLVNYPEILDYMSKQSSGVQSFGMAKNSISFNGNGMILSPITMKILSGFIFRTARLVR